MFKRGFAILLLLCLLPLTFTFAQNDTPQQVLDAVNLLNQRLGTTLTINNMEQWSYDIQVFDSSSLGCDSRPGGTAGSYLAYIVTLRYGGTTYDIRVSSDRTIAFICGSNATPTPSFCDGGQTPRMVIGTVGRVTLGGLPNSLRVQPNPTAGAVAEIPAGGQFTVLDGPRCGSGYTWWQVSYNGVVGWTPEGDATTYWIEPLGAGTATPTQGSLIFSTNTPASTITSTPTIAPTVLTATPAVTAIVPSTPIALNFIPTPTTTTCPVVPTRLTVGQQARVTLGGLPNNVRAQAGTSGAYLGEIPPGGVFNVIGGPSCASGYTWWQVDYNGLVGWTPEGDYPNYWLEPVIPLREAFSGANLSRVAQRGLIALGAYDLGGIAFYADSTSMVISQSGRAVLWDTTVSGGGTNPLANTPAYFAFSPTDASIFAILDANGRAYNLSLGEDAAIRETDLFSVPNYTLDADVYGIAWSDERQLFALRTATTLDVWDGLTGQQVASLSAGSQIVDAVVMEDASGIFYTGDDEIVYYWNAATNASQLVASFSAPVHRLALWQSTLAMVYEEAGSLAIDVRDISTGIRLYYGRLEAGIEVTSIALTNTALAIAVNSANGSAVGLWGIGSEAQVWLPDQIQPVNQMRFSPDGTILAIGSLDNAIRLWGIAAP